MTAIPTGRCADLHTEAVRSHFMSQAVEVRAVEGFAGLSVSERLAWDALFEKQSNPTPFQSLFWNESWCRVFGQPSRVLTRDAVILVLRRNDEIIAFFPMLRVSFLFLGIPLLRHLKPVGSDPNLTELKTGIVREGHERDSYAALADYFNKTDRRWELVSFPAVPAGAADACEGQSNKQLPVPSIEGFIIALAADWDSFTRPLKRNVKEAIRRSHNRFKRDGIEPAFTCLSEPGAIKDIIPAFYRLHSARASQLEAPPHPDHFQSEKSRSLMDLLVSDPANSGIRMFVLKDGDRVMAARLAFETAGGTYLYYSGYDPDYGKYSVMTRLVVEVLKRSIALGQRYVHLSFGRDGSKTRWSPSELTYTQRLIVRNSLRGRLMEALYTGVLIWRKKRANSLKTATAGSDPPSVEVTAPAPSASWL